MAANAIGSDEIMEGSIQEQDLAFSLPRAARDEAYLYVNFDSSGACTQHSEAAVTIVAPGPGIVLISGSISVELEHAMGAMDWGRYRVAEASEGCAAPGASDVVFSVPAELASGYYQQTHPATRAFPTPSAGAYTFSVYGKMEYGASAADRYLWGNLQAVWYPSA